MSEELEQVSFVVGHRCVGSKIRDNGFIVAMPLKFKATTGSIHAFNIVPNLLERDFTADRRNEKWAGDTSYI
jgi:hypothetical protein